MAENYSNRDELSSKKLEAVEKLFDKLVDESKSRVRDLAVRFFDEGIISPQQKEAALKEDGDNKKAASLIYSDVVRTVASNESAFDCMVGILRDEGLGDLSSKLLHEVMPPPPCIPGHIAPGNSVSRLKRGASWHSGTSKSTLLSNGKAIECDSGVESGRQTGLQAQVAYSSEPLLHDQELVHEHISQPKLLSANPTTLSGSPQAHISTTTSFTSDSSAKYEKSDEENVANYQSVQSSDHASASTHHSANATGDSEQLVTPVQVLGPRLYDVVEHQSPVQVAEICRSLSDVIVLPEGERLLSGSASLAASEDDLAESLRNMRQELQQIKAEGMQKEAENLHLQDKCKELEEKVEKTTEDLRIQREQTEHALKEKEDAVVQWKQKYEEKEGEVAKLRSEIAEKEKEHDEILKKHKEEINELQNEHNKTVEDYRIKINLLENELKETKQKKADAEIELAHAKEQLSKAELQKVQVEFKLNKAMHRLEMETMQLKVSLSQTKEELAKEQKAKTERELCDQRRHSVQIEQNYQQQLQNKDNEIVELKRLLSQKSSSSDTDAS